MFCATGVARVKTTGHIPRAVPRTADPTDIPERLAEVTTTTRRLGRAVFTPALSATDIAAWDLAARRAGKFQISYSE